MPRAAVEKGKNCRKNNNSKWFHGRADKSYVCRAALNFSVLLIEIKAALS